MEERYGNTKVVARPQRQTLLAFSRLDFTGRMGRRAASLPRTCRSLRTYRSGNLNTTSAPSLVCEVSSLEQSMSWNIGSRTMMDNMSIDTDPQQQEAASPQVLVVRSFLR